VTVEPRTPLTKQQYEELLLYADNRPHKFHRPNTNLIRRNLLAHYRVPNDTGFYQITEFGRAVLAVEAHDSTALRTMEIDQLVQEILHQKIGWTESLKRLEEIARGNLVDSPTEIPGT
jgi:hypothetical protein